MPLINQEDLLATLDGMVYTARDGSDVPRQVRMVVDAIRNAPAVDAVEVVRCDECKSFKDNMCEDEHIGAMVFRMRRKQNDFCSYGKRKGSIE